MKKRNIITLALSPFGLSACMFLMYNGKLVGFILAFLILPGFIIAITDLINTIKLRRNK